MSLSPDLYFVSFVTFLICGYWQSLALPGMCNCTCYAVILHISRFRLKRALLLSLMLLACKRIHCSLQKLTHSLRSDRSPETFAVSVVRHYLEREYATQHSHRQNVFQGHGHSSTTQTTILLPSHPTSIHPL